VARNYPLFLCPDHSPVSIHTGKEKTLPIRSKDSIMNFVISDSNDEVITALRLVLEQKLDFTIMGTVNDVIGLFSTIIKQCPDAIILDVDLIGLKTTKGQIPGGLNKLIEIIHQLCPSIYILALSYLPNLEKMCVQAGVDAFACKSDPPDKLLAHLENLSKLRTKK